MNKVTTTSACGRCGTTEVRIGNCNNPPIGWGPVTVMRRAAGTHLLEGVFGDDLCPACQDVVMAVLKQEPLPCLCSLGHGIMCAWHKLEAPDAD